MQADPVGVTQGVRSISVIVEDHRQPLLRTVQYLSSETVMAVEVVIRLPSVDDPGLNLQLVRGKPLDAHSVEEPWCVGGHIRRLVGPVVEVVVAEQTDV